MTAKIGMTASQKSAREWRKNSWQKDAGAGSQKRLYRETVLLLFTLIEPSFSNALPRSGQFYVPAFAVFHEAVYQLTT